MAFDEVNAKGGVNGSKLKLLVEDDQHSTPKTVAAHQKLVSSDGVKFVIALTYGGVFALSEKAKKEVWPSLTRWTVMTVSER
jgi:ABC-type branched-subunit amino acid transport system substrate-binding protein